MANLSAGAIVDGRYGIVRMLSEGGMGAVYVAEHQFLRKQVALKVLHAEVARDAEAVARFEREARAASRIDHPNIVRVTDFGRTADGEPYLVMELLAGHTLADELTRAPRLSPTRARFIAAEILRGLEAAHQRGVVHRDLKPENVIVIGGGESDAIKLVDFGIAQLRSDGEARMTATGRVMGTPLYMAPEQVRGQADLDARADLYSVGVMLYEMLSGQTPYQGATFGALAHEILSGKPRPFATVAPDVEPVLGAIVMKAFAPDRALRFADARELREALERALPDAPLVAEPYRQARAAQLTDLPRGPQLTTLPSRAPIEPAGPPLASTGPPLASTVAPKAAAPAPDPFAPVEEPALELDLPPPSVAPSPPKPGLASRLMVPLIAAAVVIAVAGVAWRVVASQAGPIVSAPGASRFWVENLPAHARLFLDDVAVTSPFAADPARREHRLRIEARGYDPRVVLFSSDGEHVIDGRLVPRR